MKKRLPKSIDHYFKSIPKSINSRVGKGSYKAIKNEFNEESWKEWFQLNLSSLNKIIESKRIPSIERINPKMNYSIKNCIRLPLQLNKAIGKIGYLNMLKLRFKVYIQKNLEDIPEELREYYIKKYINEEEE